MYRGSADVCIEAGIYRHMYVLRQIYTDVCMYRGRYIEADVCIQMYVYRCLYTCILLFIAHKRVKGLRVKGFRVKGCRVKVFELLYTNSK